MADDHKKGKSNSNGGGGSPTASFGGVAMGPGSQFGQFRVEQELGRGGAGVVYLAQDTKLDRSVAIKSLPPEVKDNPKALSRFTREAKVLASLNHPNIATIYDELEEANGIIYLVLEYVPGQTLAERIAKGRLKLEEVLTIALQIAEAVAAAHEHDIIHRDLKPGNIKITAEGKIKVLDFGLAKVVGGETTDQQTTITEPGRIIGTPAYMSPEQARGQQTDKRCDIWSFGCVLYEMLTGKVPFEGETVSDTLAGILEREPDWHALPQATPVNIQVLVRRCLEKDPRRRLRDIGDASIEIHETLGSAATVPPVGVLAARLSRGTLQKVAVSCAFFAGLVVGIIGMLTVMRGPTRPSEPRLVKRYSISLAMENPLAPDPEEGYATPVLTPDGRQLIYVAGTFEDTYLVARPLDSLEAQRIRGTQGARWPEVSPDGRWLAFSAKGAIWKVPLAGGTPERITDNLSDLPFVWEGENSLILSTKIPRAGGLSRFDLRTRESEALTTLDATSGHDVHVPIQLDPERKILFFIAASTGDIETWALFALSLENHQIKPLVERAWGWYAPSGHLIYRQRGRLMAAPFDIKTLQITGPETNVTEDRMATDETVPTYTVSPEGTLIYVSAEGSQERNRELVWVDLEGNEKPLGARPMRYEHVRVSGDTARPQVAAKCERCIWIYDTGGAGPIRRLTFPSEGNPGSAIWSPDNSKIVFFSWAPGSPQLYRKAVDGSGEAEVLSVNASGWRSMWTYARTPDGKVQLAKAISSEEISRGWDIVAIHLDRDGEVEPLLVSDDNEHFAALSSDGKWLAYVSDELDRDDVFVTSYPDLEGKWQVSAETEGGREPVWAPDGTAIYYRDGASLVAVPVSTEGGFKLGRAQSLFKDVYVPRPTSRNYDIHPDGKRFLMIKEVEGQEQGPITELIVVENWFEKLKRRVPAEKSQ